MRKVGGGPAAAGAALLARFPGFRQMAQLQQVRGRPPEDMAKMFGIPKERPQGMPAAGGKGSHAAAQARARLMGFQQGQPRQLSDDERKRLREKRKKERQNKKKSRKR